MTQVESGKEEGAKPTKCEHHGGDSGPASHNEETITRKLQHPKTGGSSGSKKAAELKISSPQLNQRPKSGVVNTMSTIKVYRNGESQEPHEFNFKQDLKHARTWSAVLDMLSAAISTKYSDNFNVAKVFTTQGKKVISISDLECCNEIVVCGNEPYQTLAYGLSTFSNRAINRTYVCNKSSKVRRSDRDAIVKSVIFEPTQSVVEEISQTTRKNPMVKTFSEQDVSSIENSHFGESMSPKLRPRNTHSPKPRPVSAYHHVASVHGGDRRSPMAGLVSRIPKRIVSNSNNRGSSPNVASVNSVNSVISHNNMHNRNGSQRRTPESKINVSERTSRHDASRREFIRPRLVTIIRHGMKPRKAVRFLLNKKTARSYDQVLTDITDSIKPDWGAVRRVYTLNGAEVTTLEDFFGTEDIFLACANDRINPEDLELDFEECKAIQPYVKVTLVHKHSRTIRGLESKSPQRKSCKGTAANTPTPQAAGPSHPKNIPLSHFPSPILDKYEVGGIIGDGNFAVVRDCTDRGTKKRYALKVIDKSKCNGRDVPPEHEIAILTTVSHPNIIVLYEQYDFSNELYVVMELVEGGDLFDAIADVTKFSEKDSKSMTKDISSALDYLHKRRIVHRDIKPENLLVYFQNDGQRRIKLGDFGLAQVVAGPMYTVCGTPTYVAPEILAETGYGLKVDMWALGVIVYVLLCGYPPFVSPTGDQEDLFDLILSGDFEFHREHWDSVSVDAKDIISRMIEPDSDSRLTAEEVLMHPWLAANSEEREERRKQMFQRDFRLTVFEAMGLSNLQ